LAGTPSFYFLEDFAQEFLRDRNHHEQVQTEELAEAFRRWCRLSPFPSLYDLQDLCRRAGVKVADMPISASGLPGANTWTREDGHSIFLGRNLPMRYVETTLCHELREVIEQTFARVKPSYVGLITHNNREMHAKSERFAGALLMQAEASRARLRHLGYDFAVFAKEKGRSLPSVVVRAQELFSAKFGDGFVGGLWLFELPWSPEVPDLTYASSLRVVQRAHLRGFSLKKNGRGRPQVARSAFPDRESTAQEFESTQAAFKRRRSALVRAGGFDMFQEQDYLVGAEPFVRDGVPWRILMTAVRWDCVELVSPWLRRLNVALSVHTYQAI
jgi:Zn-dependent peptidase ImmA (M78 family)